MNIKKWLPIGIILFSIVTAVLIRPTPPYIKGVAIVGDPGTLQIGTQYSIIWDSKNVKTVSIALEKDGLYIKNLIWNLENNGGAVWTPDRSLQPGENYQIVISDRTTDWGKPVVYRSKNFTIEAYQCSTG